MLKNRKDKSMSDNNSQRILCTVAGHDITEEELNEHIAALPPEQRDYSNKEMLQKYVLSQIESAYLFEQLAIEQNLEDTEEYKLLIAESRREILSQLAIKKLFEENAATDEEALDFYKKHPNFFVKREGTEKKLKDFEEVSEEIKAKISQVKQNNIYQKELNRLKEKYEK